MARRRTWCSTSAFSFAVTDPEEADGGAGRATPRSSTAPTNPFEFADRRRPSLWSLSLRTRSRQAAGSRSTSALRVDYSRLLIHESQCSPRVGAACQLRPGTTLRGSWHAPLPAAAGGGPAPRLFGGRARLSPFVDDEIRRQRRLGDPAGATDVDGRLDRAGPRARLARRRVGVGAVAAATSTIRTSSSAPPSPSRTAWRGSTRRVRAAAGRAPRRGWSGSLSYSHARSCSSALSPAGCSSKTRSRPSRTARRFTPDHDQRHALYAHDQSTRTSGGGCAPSRRLPLPDRHAGRRSTSDDVDRPARAAGIGNVDFESGRVKARAVLDLLAEWVLTRGRRTDATLAGLGQQRHRSDLRLQLRQSVQRHPLRGRAAARRVAAARTSAQRPDLGGPAPFANIGRLISRISLAQSPHRPVAPRVFAAVLCAGCGFRDASRAMPDCRRDSQRMLRCETIALRAQNLR